MGNHSCTLYNDLKHVVQIVDYDGTRNLWPGARQTNWLAKGGNYYISLVLSIDNKEEKVYLYGSEFDDREHRMLLLSECFQSYKYVC